MSLPLVLFLERIKQIDQLIRLEATGTPEQLASKIGISRSMLYEYLAEMKNMGAPLKYDRCKQTFYYFKSVCFKYGFTYIHEENMANIRGGVKMIENPVLLDGSFQSLRLHNKIGQLSNLCFGSRKEII